VAAIVHIEILFVDDHDARRRPCCLSSMILCFHASQDTIGETCVFYVVYLITCDSMMMTYISVCAPIIRIGFNPYVECDATHKTYASSAGLIKLMNDYKNTNYARPIVFGEFGCVDGITNTIGTYEQQRNFYDVRRCARDD
jgi:hypothetical protein